MKKKIAIIAVSLALVVLIVACGQLFMVRDVRVVFYNKTTLTNEAEVLKASGLSVRTNIFNLRESQIKNRVAKHYGDNEITVTNVVRKFPDEVILYVKERIPIFKIPVFSSDGFVPTDKDFQRGKVVNGEYDLPLITVKNFAVRETFDVKECRALRQIALAFINLGVEEEGLPYFLSSINFAEDGSDKLILTVRAFGTELHIASVDINQNIQIVYDKFIALSESERFNAILTV